MGQSDLKPIYESPDGGKTVFARIGKHRQQIPVEQHVLDSWRAEVYRMMISAAYWIKQRRYTY